MTSPDTLKRLERAAMRPNVGDEFHIKKRYDKGGYPKFRVLKVRTISMRIIDLYEDGSDGEDQRDFYDQQGWPTLRKYWKCTARAAAGAT